MKSLKESENYLDIVRRVNRCVGHMEGIRNMLEQDRAPNEILVQLTAIRASVSSLSRLVMCTYVENSVRKAAEMNDLDELEKAIESFKQLYK